MESIYLKTLIDVVQAGSIAKAAEDLCVTPSAVSRRIKFLEEQYGHELLDRSGPVLVPTEAGQLVLEKARRLIEIERELLSGLSDIGRRRKISFGCTPAFGIAYLPGILKEFMLNNADLCDLKFIFDMPDQVVKGLKENLFDLAVIEHCACFDLKCFKTIALPTDEMVFISAPSLGLESSVLPIDTLVRHRLYSRKDGCCSRQFLDMNMKVIGRDSREFQKIIIYDDLHLIIQAVMEGEGIAFLSKSVVERHLGQGTLCDHRVEGFRHDRQRTFVLTDRVSRDTIFTNFIECVFGAFNLPSPAMDALCS